MYQRPVIGSLEIVSPCISTMYFSLWKTPGVSERMWSVNLEGSISGEYQTLGGYSGRPSEWLGSVTTSTGVTGISHDWYRSTMGVIVILLGACRSTREIFGCSWECRRTHAGITNTPWDNPGLLWRFIWRTAEVIWDSTDAHEKLTSLNREYDSWIIVHYHFWIILAVIFFNMVLCASLH